MCGINAIFLKKAKVKPELIAKMNRQIKHRGPDGEGEFISKDAEVGLGHLRLSIVDLSSRGNQPMEDSSGRYVIVFNGEIYNFQELKENLEGEGEIFKTKTDTEVILALYKKMGAACLGELRGMFAFAIYDKENKELFLARDRFGQKPLVYTETDEGFIATSELPAILKTGLVEKKINLEALGYYFLHNFVTTPDPLTIFEGIYKLQPSHYMIVRNGSVDKIERYWTPDFSKTNSKNAPAEVRKRLGEAVQMREMADVEISVLLSGGLDSSAIVALLGKDGIRSYAFGASKNDEELARARLVAKEYQTKHKEIIIHPDQLDILEKIIENFGEPIYNIPLTYAYSLSEKVNEDKIKVALTGNGGDELFFGYDGSNRLLLLSYFFRLFDLLPKGPWKILKKALRGGEGEIVAAMVCAKMDKKKGEIYRIKSHRLIPKLFSEKSWNKVKNVDFGKIIDSVCAECNSNWYIDSAYWSGISLENSHAVHIVGDIPAMANGIEFRSPFLDHKLAEYAFGLVPSEKVGSLFSADKNKYVLKKSMEGLLPNQIIYAKKMGFGYNVSIAERIRTDWRERIEKTILGGELLNAGILDREFIENALKEHAERRKNNLRLIMGTYALEIWYRKFMKNGE